MLVSVCIMTAVGSSGAVVADTLDGGGDCDAWRCCGGGDPWNRPAPRAGYGEYRGPPCRESFRNGPEPRLRNEWPPREESRVYGVLSRPYREEESEVSMRKWKSNKHWCKSTTKTKLFLTVFYW
jgi:hypothetical protein